MVNTKALYDIILYNKFSLKEMAYILNLEPDVFRKKLERGIFQSNEIEMMLHFLEFPTNPMKIFFDSYDYENPKKIDWKKDLNFPLLKKKKKKFEDLTYY